MLFRRSLLSRAGSAESSSPRTRASRPAPTRSQVVGAFGPELKGLVDDDHRAVPPEPRQVWSTLQEAARPFAQQLLILTGPEESSSSRVIEKLLSRARDFSGFRSVDHLPWSAFHIAKHTSSTMHSHQPAHPKARLQAAEGHQGVGKNHTSSLLAHRRFALQDGNGLVKTRRKTGSVSNASDEEGHRRNSASSTSPASSPLATAQGEEYTTGSGGGVDLVQEFKSPLRAVGSNHYDGLAISARAMCSFGKEGIVHALTDATRCLKKHGVLSVYGTAPELRPVECSDRLLEDFKEYRTYLDTTWNEELERKKRRVLEQDETPDLSSGREDRSEGGEKEGLHLMELTNWRHESNTTAFSNFYFPFQNMQCQWFTSRFALTAPEIIDVLKGDPKYANAVSVVTGGGAGRRPRLNPFNKEEIIRKSTSEEMEYFKKLTEKSQPLGPMFDRYSGFDPLLTLARSLDTEIAASLADSNHFRNGRKIRVGGGGDNQGLNHQNKKKGHGHQQQTKSLPTLLVEFDHWVLTMDDRSEEGKSNQGGVTCSLEDIYSRAQLGDVLPSTSGSGGGQSFNMGSLLRNE